LNVLHIINLKYFSAELIFYLEISTIA